MQSEVDDLDWSFESAISLLHALHFPNNTPESSESTIKPDNEDENESNGDLTLGNFNQLWDYLGRPRVVEEPILIRSENSPDDVTQIGEWNTNTQRGSVQRQDEQDGANFEDDIENEVSELLGNICNRKRGTRRARRKNRPSDYPEHNLFSIPDTDVESGEELAALRSSPDRRTIIAEMVGRPRPTAQDGITPPTSPSPPKEPPKSSSRPWHISNPFLWQTPQTQSRFKPFISVKDGLSPRARKAKLISILAAQFREERRFLRNAGLIEPAFTPLNVSAVGIHVFVDISNIMIGFHDCLKVARDMPRETHVRRVPLEFHNLSLVLERGRPAAKRVLVGSDRFPVVQQAKSIGYETNILERVHKAKEMTSHLKKFRSGAAGSGIETSGSETTTMAAIEKWVEQGVDEILHLKILESLVDVERPSTIVLATGDAAEAEYSGGFLRMVERALEKGWMVELVSFRLNTSNAYSRREFRMKWGQMFKWIQLDDFVEQLISEEG